MWQCGAHTPTALSNHSLSPLFSRSSSSKHPDFLSSITQLHNHFSFFFYVLQSSSFIMASRVAFLLFLCVLPAMVMAIRPVKNPFCLKGRVVCDPCHAGYETSAITHIAGNPFLLSDLFLKVPSLSFSFEFVHPFGLISLLCTLNSLIFGNGVVSFSILL